MPNFKPVLFIVSAVVFTLSQSAGAVGLPNMPNAHSTPHHKMLPDSDDIGTALIGGKVDLWLRYRYESVDDNYPAGHALANAERARSDSLRMAVGYTTGRFHGLYGRVEVEGNRIMGRDQALNLDDDFNVPPPPAINRAREGHAIIPDNDFTEINEAYIGWRSPTGGCPNAPGPCNGNTSFKLGRQTVIYDNHRWVGDVIWRQNNVSMDAIRLDNTSIKNLGISYTYVNKVKRPFGGDSIFDEYKMDDAHLINVSYTFPGWGKLTGYGYLLDFKDNPRTPFPEGTGMAPPFVGTVNFDSDTYGVRWVGKRPIGDSFTLLTEFEWANQDPTEDAIDALDDNDYYNIELGGAFKVAKTPVIFKVGLEVLEGNGVNAVQTPLATIHGFNGWADKFVAAPGGTTTPAGGLEDFSATLVVKGLLSSVIGKSKLVFQYHDYEADQAIGGLDDYGDEWNILFAKPFTKKWLGLVKYADYESDGFSVDTEKFWMMLQYRFK